VWRYVLTMKFWERTSHCRGEPALLDLVADNPAWAEFAMWIENDDGLIPEQDRAKLDYELPDDLWRYVLWHSTPTYKIHDGWVRRSRSSVPGEPLRG
jgi:hypothetical protein